MHESKVISVAKSNAYSMTKTRTEKFREFNEPEPKRSEMKKQIKEEDLE